MHGMVKLAAAFAAVAGAFALAVPTGVLAEQGHPGQGKYSLKVPDGLAFAEFKGFESWETVGVSHTDETIEVILANPKMIEAFKAGVPGNGKVFPDGSKMAKIHWTAKPSEDAPSPTTIQGPLHDIDFMARDSKRFADTGNWGYAEFSYDSKTDKFRPDGSGVDCGYACHTLVAAKDYVFTSYGRR